MPFDFDTYNKMLREGRDDKNHFIPNYSTLALFNSGAYDRKGDNIADYDMDLVKYKLDFYQKEKDKCIDSIVGKYKTKIELAIYQWFLDYTIYRYKFLLADDSERKYLTKPSDRMLIRVEETSGYDIGWEMSAATKAAKEISEETGYNIHVTLNPDAYMGWITIIFY